MKFSFSSKRLTTIGVAHLLSCIYLTGSPQLHAAGKHGSVWKSSPRTLISGSAILSNEGAAQSNYLRSEEVKTLAGTLTLTGANAYSGSTTINAGNLVLNAGSVQPTTATLNLANYSGPSLTNSVDTISNTINIGPGLILISGAPQLSHASNSLALGAPAPVPEPSSAVLALIGAGFLSQRRRRRG